MFPLYIRGLPAKITLDDLIIYFQSGKSGGGDVDNDACKFDGDKAIIVFEKKECKLSINLMFKQPLSVGIKVWR